MSVREVPGRSRAETVEVIWWTVGYVSTSNRASTRTEPVSATIPRSLRNRSTIIRFSALSLGLFRNCSTAARSSPAQRPRRAVPFIGRVVMTPSCSEKNSSGEAERMAKRPVSRYAQNGARCAVHIPGYCSRRFPPKAPRSGKV